MYVRSGSCRSPGASRYASAGLNAAGAAVPEPGEGPVGEHAKANLHWTMPRLGPDGQNELEWAHKVRGDEAGVPAALPMGLANELDITQPEITQTSVDELRGGARRCACRIAAVDECDAGTRTGRRPGRRGPDRAASDHEQVERLDGEPLEPLGPGRRCCGGQICGAAEMCSCPAPGPFDGPQPVGILGLSASRIPGRLDDLDRSAQLPECLRPTPEAGGEPGGKRRAAHGRLAVGGHLNGPTECVCQGLNEHAIGRHAPVDPERPQPRRPCIRSRLVQHGSGLERDAFEGRPDDVGAGRVQREPEDGSACGGVPPGGNEPLECRDEPDPTESSTSAAMLSEAAASGRACNSSANHPTARPATAMAPSTQYAGGLPAL